MNFQLLFNRSVARFAICGTDVLDYFFFHSLSVAVLMMLQWINEPIRIQPVVTRMLGQRSQV